MSSVLVTGIGELTTNDDASHGDAVVLDGSRVAWVGPSAAAPDCDAVVDVEGRAVLPGFVDSHAHLMFAGDRAAEFAARMAGETYTAGGIRTTVAATRAASDDALLTHARALREEARRSGTTTMEIKSGYGLTVADESRSLQLATQLTDETTFLGAHVVPPEYASDRAAYVDLVAGDMLVACAPHARWIDVFCDRGAFDADETRTILRAGVAAGLTPRLHGNQLAPGPGVAVAVEFDAASVDHCVHLAPADVDALAGSRTVASLVPGADFSTRGPWPDARALLDAGVTVALASDCNPGTSFTTNVPFCIALAVRDLHMTVAEAVWSATAGGAAALRRDDVGVVRPGARADLLVLDAPSAAHLAYRPGVPLTWALWESGTRVV
ncbi:imidazolonepropionase [Jatrophihabitans sp. YIM 134969]